jgi:hypothetical protein
VEALATRRGSNVGRAALAAAVGWALSYACFVPWTKTSPTAGHVFWCAMPFGALALALLLGRTRLVPAFAVAVSTTAGVPLALGWVTDWIEPSDNPLPALLYLVSIAGAVAVMLLTVPRRAG